VTKMNTLNALSTSPSDAETNETTFSGTVWISKEELQDRILETLSDAQYNEWVNCMDRLANHHRHAREKEFIESFRKPLSGQVVQKTLPPVLLEADGKQSVKVESTQTSVIIRALKPA